MSEVIDIYNANLEKLGKMERLEAHLTGQWHKTFHCWVTSKRGGGSILFQLRSPEMVNFPNMLDVSAAGHLEAGESVEEGVREVTEELGLSISWDAFHFLGYRIEVADQDNGQKNREYQAVYLLQIDQELTAFKPQVEEISGLVWMRLSDGLLLFSHRIETATIEGIRYNKTTQQWRAVELTVSRKDFLPRIQNYYLTACIMAERLLENRLPLAIS